VVERFVAAINDRDVAQLSALMSDDHRFVDATGAVHEGRATMTEGWKQYFASFPVYRIDAESTVASGSAVMIFGWASGTARADPGGGRGQSWRFPAAWKGIVRGGRVAEWHVCGDIEPMIRSMGLNRW